MWPWPRGEIPDVAGTEVVDAGVALRINDRRAHTAGDDIGPFGRRGVPMQILHQPRFERGAAHSRPRSSTRCGTGLPIGPWCRFRDQSDGSTAADREGLGTDGVFHGDLRPDHAADGGSRTAGALPKADGESRSQSDERCALHSRSGNSCDDRGRHGGGRHDVEEIVLKAGLNRRETSGRERRQEVRRQLQVRAISSPSPSGCCFSWSAALRRRLPKCYSPSGHYLLAP